MSKTLLVLNLTDVLTLIQTGGTHRKRILNLYSYTSEEVL